MRNFIFFIIFFSLILTTHLCFSEDYCENISVQELEKHLPGPLPPNSKIMSNKKENGLCQSIVDINGKEVPFYSTKDFVIVGQMFQNKKNLSAEALSNIKKSYFTKVKDKIDGAVTFSLSPNSKKPKHKIYFFTDPLCPYCHRAIQKIKDFSNRTDTNVEIVLYSVHGEKGNKEIEKVICSNMNFDTYSKTNFPLTDKNTTCEKGIQRLKQAQELAKELKISAVPAFILEDGTQVTGADLKRLEMAVSTLSNSNK